MVLCMARGGRERVGRIWMESGEEKCGWRIEDLDKFVGTSDREVFTETFIRLKKNLHYY